jgi:tetratricopeptide (TPR) repeat protein
MTIDPSLAFDASCGAFIEPESRRAAAEALDNVLDKHDSGRLTPKGQVAALKALAARFPDDIDIHAHLGFALLDAGKPKLALEACRAGLTIGEAVLPPKRRVKLEWGWHENRPFLRAAHGAVLCELALGHRPEAIAMMEKMLAWNPSDNQGMRLLIGPELLRAGDTGKAKSWLTKTAEDDPWSRHELGLLLFRDGHHGDAATALRLAFLENPYIAEVLTGTLEPIPLVLWHGSNLAEIGHARAYAERYGELWGRTPDAQAFLRWVHMHPEALTERAEFVACRQALLWTDEVEERRRILAREDALRTRILAKGSAEMIKPGPRRGGVPVAPWLRPLR